MKKYSKYIFLAKISSTYHRTFWKITNRNMDKISLKIKTNCSLQDQNRFLYTMCRKIHITVEIYFFIIGLSYNIDNLL